MSKDSSAKYYRDKKERRQKQASEKYRRLLKEEQEKSGNTVVNNIKIPRRWKTKAISVWRKYYKMRKNELL